MKKYLVLLFIATLLLSGCGVTKKSTSDNNNSGSPSVPRSMIIDHTCTNVYSIPINYIVAATANLHIAYGHTSHGSQLIDGMNGLVAFMNTKPGYAHDLFAWNNGGVGGALDLRDELGDYGFPYGAADLNNPDYVAWATATRTYLSSHPTVNVIVWAWCIGVTSATSANINTYLSLMNQLEIDYPAVKFVYMTGHLDGTGLAGNLHARNQQIRAYCSANNKILYDFADIESYDPDGIGYLALNADDACSYAGGNWAQSWQTSHVLNVDWYSCGSAHSEPLNANRKAYAAWWLWARLAGWDGK